VGFDSKGVNDFEASLILGRYTVVAFYYSLEPVAEVCPLKGPGLILYYAAPADVDWIAIYDWIGNADSIPSEAYSRVTISLL
jgi:hypothetical protein